MFEAVARVIPVMSARVLAIGALQQILQILRIHNSLLQKVFSQFFLSAHFSADFSGLTRTL
jgi:hypothetical protein